MDMFLLIITHRSHGVDEEAVQGTHCDGVATRVEVHCGGFTLVVHFGQGRAFSCKDGFAESGFFVVEFVLGIGAIEIDEMEVVVVVSCEDGVAIGRGSEVEAIEDALVFDHITEFAFEGLLNGDAANWLLGVADVPYFESEIVT